MQKISWLCLGTILLVAGCGPDQVKVVRLNDHREFPGYRLQRLVGLRDGDQFRATAILTDGKETLSMDMLFKIGVPTRLMQGSFDWLGPDDGSAGQIGAKSVSFFGGQSDLPSLGGDFGLLHNRQTQFSVHIPVTPVKPPYGVGYGVPPHGTGTVQLPH